MGTKVSRFGGFIGIAERDNGRYHAYKYDNWKRADSWDNHNYSWEIDVRGTDVCIREHKHSASSFFVTLRGTESLRRVKNVLDEILEKVG